MLEGKLSPPATLCFDQNPDETLKFFHGLRSSLTHHFKKHRPEDVKWVMDGRTPKSMRRLSRYYDYSQIEYISTAAALVLAAEYDRARSLMGSVPPSIELDKWHPQLFRKLFELGFFEIVGLTEDVADRYRTDGDVRSMRIVSGTDSGILNEAAKGIVELASFAGNQKALEPEIKIALNSSLAEAMINVARHAYPHDHVFAFPHVRKLWVTASSDRATRELTVVIYDQGASIPVTFPTKKLVVAVIDFLKEQLSIRPEFAYQNDGAYIEAAMQPGNTQTNQVNQGLGLPEMKELIDICRGGELSIISRGGHCRYKYGDRIVREYRSHSVGGTLIQWCLSVGEL